MIASNSMWANILEDDLAEITSNLGDRVLQLAGKTILISGSSGFLGRHFLLTLQHFNRHVLAIPCRVIAIDNLPVEHDGAVFGVTLDPMITFIRADICDPLTLREPVDYIVHMAGIASPVHYMQKPLETIRSAVHGTENLLEFARQQPVKKFLVFSSSEIYGDPSAQHIPTPETYLGQVSTLGPRACYDESKRMGETMAMTYHRLFQIPIQIIRPFNIYGPGMRQDDHRVVPQFLTCALKGQPLPIHGQGLQTRSYCYVTDALTGFFQVLLDHKHGQVYNIGNPEELSLNRLAEVVTGLIKPTSITHIPYPDTYPADEPMRRCPDISKAKSELGYFPKVGVRDGLERTLAWFKHDLDQGPC